jgi:hypothetical protein
VGTGGLRPGPYPLEARGIYVHMEIRRQRIHLQLDPRRSRTYSVAFVRGAPNYNGMLPNRRIVMVLLQTTKIVMVPIQKTNGFKGPKKFYELFGSWFLQLISRLKLIYCERKIYCTMTHKSG